MADELHISKRLRDLLPSLTEEERKQLQANIKTDGRVTDPVLFWFDGKKNVVADGMHRFEIARREDIPYPSEEIKIEGGYEEVEVWMLNRQLGRRNLLSPQAIRKIRGELYNKLKGQRGGDHTSEKAKCQNDTLLGDAAEEIAGKAGVSEATVKRDGARVTNLKKCSNSIQKGVNSDTLKLSDGDITTLSKLNAVNQDNISNDLRKGQAKTVTEAMEKRKIKTPGEKKPKKKTKPPKKLDKAAYYKQWETAIGPVVRLVDKIANGVDKKGGEDHECVHEALDHATKIVAAWMGVKL